MKYVEFPFLGRRPVTEFQTSGVLEPEPPDLGDWTPGRWVYERSSVPRERTEWWYHTPSRLWFKVRRDTGSDAVLAVELARRAADA
jgi:sarcosine oxidase, subunit delta